MNAVLNELSLKFPTYLFSVFYSKELIGHLFQARRLVLAPSLLVADAFKKVMFQQMAENHVAGQSSYRLAFVVYTRFVLFSIVPAGCCLLWGDQIVSTVLGEAWLQSGNILQVIIISVVFQVAYLPLSSYFEIVMEQRITLVWNVVMIVARVVAIVAGASYGGFDTALVLFTAVNAVGYVGISALVLQRMGTDEAVA
jgi:O-antigen/teichoic acid export membrane protein